MVFDSLTRHQGKNLSAASFDKLSIDRTSDSRPTSLSAKAGEMDFRVIGRFPTLKEMEQYLIDEALQSAKGNQGAAAAMLGLTRQALNKRLCRK